MSFIDITLIKQLIDIAQEVNQRKCKNASGQVFTTETEFIKKHCQSGLIKKINVDKKSIERKHPIEQQKNKCVIYKLLLKTFSLGYDVPNSEMSYANFFIRYEHKFLRNIYSDSEIAESLYICTLQNYYVV